MSDAGATADLRPGDRIRYQSERMPVPFEGTVAVVDMLGFELTTGWFVARSDWFERIAEAPAARPVPVAPPASRPKTMPGFFGSRVTSRFFWP